jgi:hypothetical protein
MTTLRIGLLSGAFAHKSNEDVLAYLGPLATSLKESGYEVVPIPYKGNHLLEYAHGVVELCMSCDIIICYSMGGIVASIAMTLDDRLLGKEWIGVSVIPARGLSLRGFSWALWQLLGPFLVSFWSYPFLVRPGERHVQSYMGTSLARYRTFALFRQLHPEPLFACLQMSFPKLFGLRKYLGKVPWRLLILPACDGFVSPRELRSENTQTRIDVAGSHAWIMTHAGVRIIRDQINPFLEDAQSA